MEAYLFTQALRPRRQADEDETAPINSDEIDFQLGLLMDAVPTYRNLPDVLPEYSQLTVYADPQVYLWTELKVVTSSNRTLQVKVSVIIHSSPYKLSLASSKCMGLCLVHILRFLYVCYGI